MPAWVLDKKYFIKGLALSDELGGFWKDQKALDFYRTPGVFRPGFSAVNVITNATSPAATALIRYLVRSAATGQNNIFYGLSSTKAFKITASPGAVDTVEALSFATAKDIRGVSPYKLGNGNSAIFYALAGDVGCYNIAGAFGDEGNWDHDFMSTIPAGAAALSNSSDIHPLYHFRKTDVLYIGAENVIDQFDANVGANGTLSKNVLDLPKDIQIVDIKELGNYLAILGVFGRNTSTLEGLCRSHIFFWDTYSPSWNYDYPLEDHVRKLVYDRGKLYAIGEGSGLNLYQLGLDGAVLRESFLATSAAGEALISLDAQRRNTNNLGVGTAALANNGLILIAAKHNNNLHVFSYGSQANVPKVLNKMLFGREAVGTVDIGDILFINARRFYLSWQDDNGAAADDYNLVRLGPTGGQSGAYGDTVELDNYFGGSGRLKTLKKIRLEFDPITSGDYFSLYYTKDYGTSYRFIVDNTGSKTRISNDVASTIQVGSATSYEFLNSEIGLFRQLNLRLYSDYGNPQIRRIIVYWDYADT